MAAKLGTSTFFSSVVVVAAFGEEVAEVVATVFATGFAWTGIVATGGFAGAGRGFAVELSGLSGLSDFRGVVVASMMIPVDVEVVAAESSWIGGTAFASF